MALSYKCPGVMEVVVEEVFSTADYYPILLLDFSSFLSNHFFNNRKEKKKHIVKTENSKISSKFSAVICQGLVDFGPNRSYLIV